MRDSIPSGLEFARESSTRAQLREKDDTLEQAEIKRRIQELQACQGLWGISFNVPRSSANVGAY